MGVQLVVGGSYSGKRKLVREKYDTLTWHSAYTQSKIEDGEKAIKTNSVVVFEGWEEWIKAELLHSSLDDVKTLFIKRIDEICEVEKSYHKTAILIMLEMGRGIVPLHREDRDLRDIAGWLLQYATNKADTVHYCWHGLVQQLK